MFKPKPSTYSLTRWVMIFAQKCNLYMINLSRYWVIDGESLLSPSVKFRKCQVSSMSSDRLRSSRVDIARHFVTLFNNWIHKLLFPSFKISCQKLYCLNILELLICQFVACLLDLFNAGGEAANTRSFVLQYCFCMCYYLPWIGDIEKQSISFILRIFK